MTPKRTSTSTAPAMSQTAIRKLVADSVAAALEAQVVTMANTDSTTRNTRQRETLIVRKCSYKEFMSCQPFNFKCTEGAVGLTCWFERTESVFSYSNCIEDCTVKCLLLAKDGDVQLTGPEIIHETTEKIVQILQRLQAVRDWQRSYALFFWMIGPVAYTLELPEELSNVHSTFHVSNLKKCLSDESLVILMKELRIDEKLNFVEEPIEIMDREVKQLRQSRIPIVKEVDIIKKTENQAKMTKLSMEWKRLCKIKAKVQKCQSQSQYRRISSQTGAGTEEYYWMQSLPI
ncbi:hypothetical protein Tco_0980286 [Tanacetum coccineum]